MIADLDDSRYFLCDLKQVVSVAKEIDRLPLDLNSRLHFVGTPLPKNANYLLMIFYQVSY